MKYLLWLCLVLLWGDGAARAQISYPSLLSTPFDDSPSLSGLSPTLLQPRPETLPAPGITWEGRDELTVHTNKGRQGLLEDIHANGSLWTLRAALRKSAAAPQLYLSQRSLETGLIDNDGGKALQWRGHFRQPEIRLSWPLPHRGLAYAGYRETTYDADGTTRLYENVFTIFPQTPPFRYESREYLALAGLRLPLSASWTAEAVLGRREEPSRLTLSQPVASTQIILPFGDSGITMLLALRQRLTHSSSLTAFFGGETLQGTGSVEREMARIVGSANTTHRQESGGLGWQRNFGEHRTLGVFLETSRDRWQTSGFVPDPRGLQTTYPLTSDLHYGASYTLRKEGLGVRWSHITSGRQEFHGMAQLLHLSVRSDADYAIRYFGLPKAGRTSYQQARVQVILLSGRYVYPWKRFRFGLEATQLIPLGAGGGGGGNGGGSDGGGSGEAASERRMTSGGWALNARIERLF